MDEQKLTVRNVYRAIPDHTCHGRTYHVAVHGDDGWEGSLSRPLRTISAAAALAGPGDLVTIHAGVYRESINLSKGGESPERSITFQAADNETVVVKGSEPVRGWRKERRDTGRVTP